MRTWIITVMLALTAPICAFAQETPSSELGVGYSVALLRGESGGWTSYPGWRVEAVRYISPHWGIAAAVEGNYNSRDDRIGEYSHRIHAFLGGFKTAPSLQHRVTPYFEALAGIGHFGDSIRPAGLGTTFHHAGNAFVFEPGAGARVAMTSRLVVKVGFDATLIEPWHAIAWSYPQLRPGVSVIYTR